jgi:dienelactone hydrolase
MKSLQVIVLIITAIYTQACANNNHADAANDSKVKDTVVTAAAATAAPAKPDSFAIGKVIDAVTCTADASQSFALYIPAKSNKEPMPIVYCFDPHGKGSLPLTKYKSLADTYGFILVGSNNSKNGNDWSRTQAIWTTLLNDTKKRLPVNANRMYVCGFSGGAKVAGYVAMNDPEIKGVIAGGAGLPDGTPAGNFNFSFTALAGEGDMNMTELIAITNALDKTKTKHRIIFFNGKHEWAPEQTMNIAFEGWQFDAMRQQLIPKNEAFINDYIAKSKKSVEAYAKSNQLLKATNECTLSAALLEGLTDQANWFKQKMTSIEGTAAYQQQQQARQQLLAKEEEMKAQYMQQFQQADMNYWSKTISDLQSKAKAQTAEGAMYQRLLAYLSLAFYSVSNQLINSNQNNQAQYVVELYKLADPTNSEAWYFSALLHARGNQAQQAESDLQKAVSCGFNDKDRLHQQPEFQQVLTQQSLAQIEAGIK